MATRMQQRRGTAAQWISTNSGAGPVLNAGEMGWESDTNKFKIGDGVNNWTSLDYFSDINSTVDPSFGSSITFEGATANAFETTLTVTDPTADRTLTFPDATGTVALTSDITVTASSTTTLSNKSISLGSNTITSTLAQLNTAISDADVATLAGTETLTNKTLTSPTLTTPNIGVASGTSLTLTGDLTVQGTTTTIDSTTIAVKTAFVFEGATNNDFETTLTLVDPTADRTLTLPDATDTLVGRATTDTLTNKTLTTPVISSITNGAATLTLPTSTGTVALTTDISASNLANDSITAVKLAGDSVTASKIASSAVETAKINDLAVTTGKINDLAVTTGKIADSAVTSAKIANDTIVDADINSAAAIAQSKIASLTTDLAAKAALSGATFTGAVSGTSLTLSGDLTVNGTTTTINSTTLAIDDKNIVLGDVATPSDVTADGGGITLKGATDKTFNWIDSTDSWTSSEHLTLNATKELRLADTDSTHYVGFKSPGTVTANKVWTLPSADGTSGQVLSTNGSATLSWATAGGGGAAFSELMLIGA